METFHKFLSKICVSPKIHVSWPNLAKISRCEVAEKSSGIGDKKPASGTLFSPISPPRSRSRPKFREHCRPLTCACVQTGQNWLLFAGLIPERVQKIKNIGFEPSTNYSAQHGLIKIAWLIHGEA